MIVCQPRRSACTHRRRRLIAESDLYEIWQCIKCDLRSVRSPSQMSLFSLGEAQLAATEEMLPIAT